MQYKFREIAKDLGFGDPLVAGNAGWQTVKDLCLMLKIPMESYRRGGAAGLAINEDGYQKLKKFVEKTRASA